MKLFKKFLALLCVSAMLVSLAACGSSGTNQEASTEQGETEVQVFIAASLNSVMTKLVSMYQEKHPDVKIVLNPDSSGTLLTQIEEGYECDIFFSAAQKQMDTLEQDDKLVVEGTRANVVNNQVVVLTQSDSKTKVKGIEDLDDAANLAIAGGSVPVGKYTRKALMNLGVLPKTETPEEYTTDQLSKALGGVEINECDNVTKVLESVKEGACEVGTTYYSDTYGFEDQVKVLQVVPYDLTGDVIYPIAQVKNPDADEAQTKAAADFMSFVLSDDAKEVFDSFYFDTNVN